MDANQTKSGSKTGEPLAGLLRDRLAFLYPALQDDQLDGLIGEIHSLVEAFQEKAHEQPNSDELWSEKDVVLITYADQVACGSDPKLVTLKKFLEGFSVTEFINIVHLLPFYPYSSDDGFSVIDYCDLAPGTGSWEDVESLNQSVDLMFDLVLNHCSQHNMWFKKFLMSDPDFVNYFHVVTGDEDLSQVTRPRSLPLLTDFQTTEGAKKVWTTFSDDQVDLNFGEPKVLIEFIRILLFYIEQGARIVRLDAVAFLWKKIGTTCLHLRETHEVIKLLRQLLDQVAPQVILLTETNVPHAENISYFGDGDEAHMVYQFSLPPLVVDTFIHGDATPMRNWLENLALPPTGTTFFNFGASHDGIGVRPLEGLLEPSRFDSLVDQIRERGGLVSTRRQPDGTDTPYELNISYFDAIVGNECLEPAIKSRKFLASQSIILSLPGIPGIYFHSLVGTPNDAKAAQESGIPRRINRRKYDFEELSAILNDRNSVQSQLFESYSRLLEVRTSSKAFHPQAPCNLWTTQQLEELGDARLLAYERTSLDDKESVLVIVNPTNQSVKLNLPNGNTYGDLCNSSQTYTANVELLPFDFMWLRQL